MKSTNLSIVCAAIVLSACAPAHEKQHYKLNDNQWHIYNDGEYLRYQFIGSDGEGNTLSGDWVTSWRGIAMPAQRPTGVPATLMRATQMIAPFNLPQQTTLYFLQQDTAGARLYGVQQENLSSLHYISGGQSQLGIELFSSPVRIGPLATTLTFSLNKCINNICGTASGSGNYSISSVAIETIDTPFGTFDCYRLTVNQIMVGDGAALMPLFDGIVWVYPPLGMVKASMRFTETASGKSYFFDSINLVSTNIAINP